MKRILFIESAPQAGGSTISLFELARRLNRAEFEPLVLLCASNPHADRFAQAGITVLPTRSYCSARTPAYAPALAKARRSRWAGWLRSNRVTRAVWRASGLAVRTLTLTWPLARQVSTIIRRQHIDLVHLNDAPELHKAGIIASRMAGVPCVCHVRSMPPLDTLDRFLARWVARYVFISHAVESDQRRKGLQPRAGVVIHNALDLSAYAALDRAAARRAFGLADDDLVVGMMGRIEPWKGQRDLLAAVSTLAPQFPRLRCLIAGTPELDGQWYQDELVALVRSLNLGEIVRFVGYQSDVPGFMAALDVVAHASVQPEPFGRVLIEGMAAGLPVVAANAGGVPEIVLDGETGLLVSPGQPAELAAALARLLADRERAIAQGQRGRERATALFAIESHVAAVERVYHELL
jgi:glycosyltransferase involved in cell wall biosynthesis